MDVEKSGDDTMAARSSGDEAVRCDPPLVPVTNVNNVNNVDCADHAGDLQAEEPGYGYGV
jgi:hypothetical protein